MDKAVYSASGVCRDKNEYFELVKMQKHHRERKMRPILLICGALSLAFCVYDLIILENILAMISAGFAFLFLYPTTFSYMLEAQKLFDTEKNRVLNVTMSYVFYDNRFSVARRGKESFHSYSKINDVRTSRKKLYFFTDDKVYYVDGRSLDGMTLGELKGFLKEMSQK